MRVSNGVALCVAAALLSVAHGQTPEGGKPAKPKLDAAKQFIFQMTDRNGDDEGKAGSQMEAMAGRGDISFSGETLPTCVALPGDAVNAIVERARKTNIVIINEHHAHPFDRYFVSKVLTALKAEGYTIYAAETFSPYESLDHPEVTNGDGFHSNDPVFARTMRLAKSLGYKLASYEQTQEQSEESQKARPEESQINRRETAQTENLMAAIFRDQPDAKVLIHVGHAHVWERKRPQDKEVWMAERLKAATGRDPLTIDQTVCASGSGATVAAEALTKTDGTAQAAERVDLFIGHAPLAFRNGRVAWRQELGELATPVPTQFLGMKERVIVEARPEGAEEDVVPADRLLLFPGDTLPLLLAPGRYRVDGYTGTGRIDVPPVMVSVP